MKVICTRLPAPVDGTEVHSSPWVTLDSEYHVVSLLAEPAGRVQLQIVTDDGQSLAWFDSSDFMTVDGNLPGSWTARVGEGGELELAPESWLAAGFWEAYYDGDPTAVEAVSSELEAVRGADST